MTRPMRYYAIDSERIVHVFTSPILRDRYADGVNADKVDAATAKSCMVQQLLHSWLKDYSNFSQTLPAISHNRAKAGNSDNQICKALSVETVLAYYLKALKGAHYYVA